MATMNIGRPRKFNADMAIAQATQQFWLGGYTATSLQDLLDCMGLSKSSLYQSFGNKETLFIRCLDNYQATFNKDLLQSLKSSHSGLAFIEQLLESVVKEATSSERKGCLLVNTANELGTRDPVITEAIERGFNAIRVIIKKALQKSVLEGDLPENSDIDDLSTYLVVGISGLRTMVKAGTNYEKLQRVNEMLLSSLK
jgi:TetR/AcrR family transcriptional repressor of nem operon